MGRAQRNPSLLAETDSIVADGRPILKARTKPTNAAKVMGFAALYPSYGLRRSLQKSSGDASENSRPNMIATDRLPVIHSDEMQ